MSFYAPDIEISFHVNREERQGGWNLRQPGIPSTCSSFQPHARSVLLAPEMSLSPTVCADSITASAPTILCLFAPQAAWLTRNK